MGENVRDDLYYPISSRLTQSFTPPLIIDEKSFDKLVDIVNVIKDFIENTCQVQIEENETCLSEWKKNVEKWGA